MTPGTLTHQWVDKPLEATIGPDGHWESADQDFADYLNSLYPNVGTAYGWSWIRAFYDAVDGLGAEVVTAPVAPEIDPNVVY